MLVDHADTCRNGGVRRSGGQGLSFDLDCSFLGHIMAEQDVHQRRLARTIFAEQTDDLAAIEREIDGIIGNKRTEPLGNSRKPENGLRLCEGLCPSSGRLGLIVVNDNREGAGFDVGLLGCDFGFDVGRNLVFESAER